MNTSSSNTEQSNNAGAFLGWLPWVAGTLALILVISYYITFRALPLNEKPDAWGQFGDYMGGLLNPLISLFTLIVAVSVWKLQKSELEDTRVALEEQGKTAEQQRREQRFFDLLTVLRRVEDSIIHRNRDGHYRGKLAIEAYFIELGPAFTQTYRHGLGQVISGREITFNELQTQWNAEAPKTPLFTYLRTIHRILSDAQSTLGDLHFHYVKLLRAQLTEHELIVIALAIWMNDDWESLKNLVCKYGLLKHLSPTGLRTQLLKELPSEAFGRNAAQRLNETS